MAKPTTRTYAPVARDTAALLGGMIRTARLLRKMTAADLAERAGVSRGLVVRAERGGMGTAIGAILEMAAVLDVPVLESDPARLAQRLDHVRTVAALLPARAVPSAARQDDTA